MKELIPKIADAELAALLARIKPLVRDDKGCLRQIAPVDPRTQSYIWDPELTEVVEEGKALAELDTYHGFGAPALFKPSLAEVLAQIPLDLRPHVTAFELDPESAEVFDDSHHVVAVTLYGALPDLSEGPRSRPSPLAE